jgi:hypothetical protein
VNHRLFFAPLLFASLLLTAQESGQTDKSKPAPQSEQKPQANQTEEQATEAQIQLMRQNVRAERKKIVAANLPLTEQEATKFWPVYDRYIAQTIKINDTRYGLLKEYAQNYSSLTDAQAKSYITRWVALDRDNIDLRMKFIPEFEKVLPPKKTAMFLQLDRRLTMMIELKLASEVPLVQP